MDEPPSTRILLRRVESGDRSALNALLERMRPRILAMVVARLGPLLRARVDAEDIVQETLLAATQALPNYEWRGRKSFYGWLSTIAEHCINAESDRHRAAKRDPRREALLHSAIAASQTSPSLHAARREESDLILEALAGLSERYRTVFRLRRLEQCDNAETARALGITPNNASVLYVRAVQALTDSMKSLRRS